MKTFTEILYIILKEWKQQKAPTIKDWLKTLSGIHMKANYAVVEIVV